MKGSLAAAAVWLGLLGVHVLSFRHDVRYIGYNLNVNETATDPMDYAGSWRGVDDVHSDLTISLLFLGSL